MPARAEQFRFIPAQYAYKDATGEFVKATPISLASHETPETPQLTPAMFGKLRRNKRDTSGVDQQALLKFLEQAKKLEGKTAGKFNNSLPSIIQGEDGPITLARRVPSRPTYDITPGQDPTIKKLGVDISEGHDPTIKVRVPALPQPGLPEREEPEVTLTTTQRPSLGGGLPKREAPKKGGKGTFFSTAPGEASGKDLTTLRIGTSSRR